MSVFITGISIGKDESNNSCIEIIITAPLVKKYALNSFNSDVIFDCKYYALGAKRYAKFMTLKAARCSCNDYNILKTYFYTEKAERQESLKDFKKDINTALQWLNQSVETLILCKNN